MNLNGKVALITGGGTGIGKSIARKLGREGARVAICGRTEATLRKAEEDLWSENIVVDQFVCDVSVLGQVEAMVQALTAGSGSIHILVNNAGALEDTPLDPPNDEGWDRVIRTNLDGVYFVTSRVVSHMPERGRIINISSVLGKIGSPGAAAYCASRHGVIGFTRAAALELAPRKITVNAICPGWVETDLAKIVMGRAAGNLGISYEEFRRNALNEVPLGEMIQPEEIASLIQYLTGPASNNITGQAYSLCGGPVSYKQTRALTSGDCRIGGRLRTGKQSL